MEKLKLFIISMLLSLVFSSTVFAASLEINWVEPDKYKDIDPGNSSKARYRTRVFTALEKYFKDLVISLPEEYKMKISVTDIDLAGDVQFAHTDRIRFIKELYFPSMHFAYELLDKEQKSLISNEVKIKDMSFLHDVRSASRHNDFLYYEGEMIADWFSKTFADYLVQK